MAQGRYVVLFDGVAIPREDIRTHSSTVGFKQNFYNGKPDTAPESDEDVFKSFLSKEKNILNSGFGDWCETEYLDGSNCSLNPTSCTENGPPSYGVDVLDNSGIRSGQVSAINKKDAMSIDKMCELLTSGGGSSKNDTEEYWCKVDPSSFVLSDMDYIRAKCRWYHRNITDFEPNTKALERVRYLDLFTQCFTLRLIHEHGCEWSNEGTCFNFQSNKIDSNEKMKFTNHNLNLLSALDTLPEKENTHKVNQNLTVNYSMINNNSFSHLREYESNSCKDPKQNGKEIHPDKRQSSTSEPSSDKKCDKKKNKTTKLNSQTSVRRVNSTNEKPMKDASNPTKQHVNDCCPYCKQPCDQNLGLETSANVQKDETHVCNKESEPVVADVSLSKLKQEEISTKESSKSSKSEHNKKMHKTSKRAVKKSLEEIKDSLEMLRKDRRRKIVDRCRSTIDTSTSSSMSKVTFPKSNFNRKPKAENFNSESSTPLAKSSTTNEISSSTINTKQSTTLYSTHLIDAFIKNFRKRNDSQDEDIDDDGMESSTQNASSNTFILDSLLHNTKSSKNSSTVNNNNNNDQPIIIIEVNCQDQHDQSEESKVNNRLRRYIEGDNSCYPGRYALTTSKHGLKDLNKGESSKKKSANQPEKASIKNLFIRSQYGHQNIDYFQSPHFSLTTPDSEIGTELSYHNVGDVTVGHSTTSSSSSEHSLATDRVNDRRTRRKRCKKNTCKNCRKNDKAGECSDSYHCSMSSNKQNVYVSCWKRFCIIL